MKAKTKKLVYAALMAALVLVGSAIRIILPIDLAGTTSFHLGNIMCALAGILLGPVWGAGAAGIGSMLYDWTNPLFFSESWLTLITKAMYGLVAGLIARPDRRSEVSYRRMVMASVGGAVTYAVIYLLKSFFYNGILLAGLTPAAAGLTLLGKLPATVFNAVVAIVCAPLLGKAIRGALSLRPSKL